MKKFTKLSLVTAVALGTITSANAGTLDEAMKNVSVSGKVYVESYVKETNDNGSKSGFEIDADMKIKVKATDNLKAVIDIEADTENDEEEGSDSKQSLEISNAYFSYANSGATVNMGRMDIKTPNTDGEEGEGFLGSYNMSGVTAAAAHFITNDISDAVKASDVSAAALLGSFGPVNAEAWYVNVSDHSKNTTLVASTKLMGAKLSARYASTDFEDNTKKDGTTTIIKASGKVANIALRATYLMNDKDNAAYVTDASSANTVELVNFKMNNKADTDAFLLGVTVPVVEKVSFALDYGQADIGDNQEESEIVGKLTYKMSKSTKLSLRYADYTKEVTGSADEDKTHARLDVKYKF